MYDRLQGRLADPPRRLTSLERDVMAQAAARATAARGQELSFQLRPGLIAEMLRFYDQLRRLSQQVNRFEELIEEALGNDEVDRAAQRMRIQTRFLAGAFRDYERRVRESGGCDEHTLRERLMAEPAADPVRRVIVTMPDWIADAAGLYQADFDLLTRIPGLESLDIVSTERVDDRGSDEAEPATLEIAAERIRFRRRCGNLARNFPAILSRPPVHKSPAIRIEAAELFLHRQKRLRVPDSGGDLQPVPHNRRITGQLVDPGLGVARHLRRIEFAECAAVAHAFLEDSRPAQARLRAFENEELEVCAIVMRWHTPFAIVILTHQLVVDADPRTPFRLHGLSVYARTPRNR